MRITVDRSRCTMLGVCESIEPDVFEIDDEGDLVIVEECPDEEKRGTVEQAVTSCPTGALRLQE